MSDIMNDLAMEFLDKSPHLIDNFQKSLPIPIIVGVGEEQTF